MYAGANLGEASKLTWADVDHPPGQLHIPGTKRTSRDRFVPIHPSLRAELKAADRSKPLVAPWSHVNQWLRVTCRALGIPHASSNDLRRTFGSWLKQAGVDSLHVARLMGHSSTTMVDRVYGQLSDGSLATAISKMPRIKRGHTRVTPTRTPR
jgi:integrase